MCKLNIENEMASEWERKPSTVVSWTVQLHSWMVRGREWRGNSPTEREREREWKWDKVEWEATKPTVLSDRDMQITGEHRSWDTKNMLHRECRNEKWEEVQQLHIRMRDTYTHKWQERVKLTGDSEWTSMILSRPVVRTSVHRKSSQWNAPIRITLVTRHERL